MAGDEYTVAGGGGLRLKGAKVKKHKKKNKTDKAVGDKVGELDKALSSSSSSKEATADGQGKVRAEGEEEEEEQPPTRFKTEAERRFEEAKRRKLLEMAQSAAARPELLKTHKERVEELNTYLSKLSEHHDMPKIGPG